MWGTLALSPWPGRCLARRPLARGARGALGPRPLGPGGPGALGRGALGWGALTRKGLLAPKARGPWPGGPWPSGPGGGGLGPMAGALGPGGPARGPLGPGAEKPPITRNSATSLPGPLASLLVQESSYQGPGRPRRGGARQTLNPKP